MSKRYQVYRSEDKNSFQLVGETTDRSYVDTSASPNKTYYYKVRQVAGPLPGNFSNITSICVDDVTPPSVPVFEFLESTAFSVTLHWKPSVDDDKVDFYSVFKSTDISGPFSLLSNVIGPRYIDNSVDQDTTYFYKLSATDRSGNESDQSSEIEVTTDFLTDVYPPTIPIFISAISSSLEIALTWSASTDNVEVEHYNIYRSQNNSLFNLVGSSSTTTYADSELPIGPNFYYKLSAVDTSGNESETSSTIPISFSDFTYYELYEDKVVDGESIYIYEFGYEFYEDSIVPPTEFELSTGDDLVSASFSTSLVFGFAYEFYEDSAVPPTEFELLSGVPITASLSVTNV